MMGFLMMCKAKDFGFEERIHFSHVFHIKPISFLFSERGVPYFDFLLFFASQLFPDKLFRATVEKLHLHSSEFS